MGLRQTLSRFEHMCQRAVVPGGLIVAAMVCVAGGLGVVRGEEGTLQQAFEQAEEQARMADGEAARAKYRAIVEMHLANEAVFQAALSRLAEEYEKSGQVEEGIRFFVSRVDQMEDSKRRETLRKVFATFSLKHPDVVKKVVAEFQQASQARPAPPTVTGSQELAQAILQRGDPELRKRALERVQKMLASDTSAAEKKTALATLGRALAAKFDRAPLRPLVAAQLKAEDADLRQLALGCLPGLDAGAAELPQVARLAEDPSPRVRMVVGSALIRLGQGTNADVVIPALTRLLRDSEPGVVEATIRSMWGQYASPELDALLIELSHQPRYHHNAIYFGLSTMRPKSVAVCQRLVEELDDPDWNNSGRAAWGLTYGVSDEAKKLVEEGLLRALPEETNAYTRKQEFRALAGVATERSRPYLTSVAESDTETDEVKQAAREILGRFEKQAK